MCKLRPQRSFWARIILKVLLCKIKFYTNNKTKLPKNGIEPLRKDFQSSALPLSYLGKNLGPKGIEPLVSRLSNELFAIKI